MPNREPTERERAIMRDVSRRMPGRRVVDVEPEDPAQTLDDTGQIDVGPLDVDAMPGMEAVENYDQAVAETKEGDSEIPVDDEYPEDTRDTGELYGVRTPHAADPELSAGVDHGGFEGAEEGENWLEALEQHAAEMGPAPDEEVVVIDDSDPHRGHHPSESGDRPVADKGSGGPGGR